MRSVKEECLNRMVLFGRNALERALREYRLHYLRERNHQGLGNRLLDDFPQDGDGAQRRVPRATRRPTSLLLSCGCLSRYVRVPSEPPRGLRIVVALTSAGGPSNPRVRADPVIDSPQADFELDVLFAPYEIRASRRAESVLVVFSIRQYRPWWRWYRRRFEQLGGVVLCKKSIQR